MKVVFGFVFAVCFVLIFNFVSGEFELDPDSPEADTLDTYAAQEKRYTPRKRLSDEALEQDNAWDFLTQKRYTPRNAKRMSDELNHNVNLLDLYTAQKRFTPRKRLSEDFDQDNTFELLSQKRFIPRAVKRVAEVLEQTHDEALQEYLAQTLEKRFTPRKRMESEELDDALKLFAQKRFTPRKRLSDGLLEQEEDTLDAYTAQRTQKRYTPRKRLSTDEQADIWKEYVPEDTEKRFTPR